MSSKQKKKRIQTSHEKKNDWMNALLTNPVFWAVVVIAFLVFVAMY